MHAFLELPERFDDLDFELLTMTDDEVDAFAYEEARQTEQALITSGYDVETMRRFLPGDAPRTTDDDTTPFLHAA